MLYSTEFMFTLMLPQLHEAATLTNMVLTVQSQLVSMTTSLQPMVMLMQVLRL